MRKISTYVVIFIALFCCIPTAFSQAILVSNFEKAKVPNQPPGWVVTNTNNANWQSLSAIGYDGNEYAGNKCMYLEKSYYGDKADAWLISPEFFMEAGKKYSISFYYKNQSYLENQLQLTLGSDTLPASQTEIIWNNKFKTDYYSKGQINYTAKETGIKHLGFHAVTKETYTYLYLDQVTVEPVTCFEPLQVSYKNITTSGVSFNWSNNNNTGPVYEYGINTVAEAPATKLYTDSNSVDLSSLNPATKYYFFVRSMCAKHEKSKWSVTQFSTAYDTAGIATLECGTKVSNNFVAIQGLYMQPFCEQTYFGIESFHKFIPQVSGMYTLRVYSVNIGQTMSFSYKEAALGAGPDGFTCIGAANDFGGKFTFGPLEAGKEYLILEKAKAAPGWPSSYKYGIDCISAFSANNVNLSSLTANTKNVQVFPNPVTDKFTVTLNNTVATKYKISVIDINGNNVKNVTTNLITGKNQVIINAADLHAGMYMLKIETATSSEYHKIIKQ